MTHSRHSDLGERTFRFACDIVRFCRRISAEPGVVRQIAWQLADAGTSVAANYQEAKGAYSRREFAAKNCIVLKEARESRLWLRIILACGLVTEDEAKPLYDEADELVGIFTTGVRTLRGLSTYTKVLLWVIIVAAISLGIAFRSSFSGFQF